FSSIRHLFVSELGLRIQPYWAWSMFMFLCARLTLHTGFNDLICGYMSQYEVGHYPCDLQSAITIRTRFCNGSQPCGVADCGNCPGCARRTILAHQGYSAFNWGFCPVHGSIVDQ